MRAARVRHRQRGRWGVHARVERFVEPASLLLLRERPGAHGYELLEALGELLPGVRADMGNLYRMLRALEDEELVRSQWNEDAPGPARRRYWLTPGGERLLSEWTDALTRTRERIDAFLRRYEEGR
jgi:PadR family transcriptional regulator, regulatory protein PadR